MFCSHTAALGLIDEAVPRCHSFARSFTLRQGAVRCLAQGHSNGGGHLCQSRPQMSEKNASDSEDSVISMHRLQMIDVFWFSTLFLNTKGFYVHFKIVIITAISTQHSVSNDCFP